MFAWNIPWSEEPGGLQSMESQRVGQDLVTRQQQTLNKCKHQWENDTNGNEGVDLFVANPEGLQWLTLPCCQPGREGFLLM